MPNYINNKYIGILPPQEYYLELAKGNISGAKQVLKFGYHDDIDTGNEEHVWIGGSTYGAYLFPIDVSTLTVSSSSTDDDVTGTGARKITIEGLDTNWREVTVDVTLDGISSVTTTQTFRRVNRAFVKTAGSETFNVGNILIRHDGAGNYPVAYIKAKESQTQQAIYTVPVDKTAYLLSLSGAIVKSGGLTRNATIGFHATENTDSGSVRKLKQLLALESSGTTIYHKEFSVYEPYSEKTDLFSFAIDVSANNTQLFSNFGLIVVDNE